MTAGLIVLILVIIFRSIISKNQKPADGIALATPSPSQSPDVLAAATESAGSTQSASKTEPSPVLSPSVSPVSNVANATPGPNVDSCQASAGNLTFNVSVKDASRDINSDMSFTFIQPQDEKIPSGISVEIPKGWNIPNGNSITQGEQIGEGCLSFMLDGKAGLSNLIILNNRDLQGHWAAWDLVFGNPSSPTVVLNTFLDGNVGAGYTWTINRKFLFDIHPPITFNLTLYAKVVGKNGNVGDSLFKAVGRFVGGASSVIDKILSLF